MTVFGHKIWVALIILGGLQLVNTLAVDGAVPDVTAIVNLKSFLDAWENKAPMMFCASGDNTSTITTHNIPEGRDEIRFTGPAVKKTAEYNADGGGYWPGGVVCRQLGNHDNNYNVTTPLRYSNDYITPTKLSYTLDPEQDLVIDTRDQVLNNTNQWWWKAGGDGSKYDISNGRLTIPHQRLNGGAGIYHFGASGSFFSLLVRECTSGLYGPECTKDCLDCMNGGMCHPQTGYCVCPPGVMGSLCQTRCPLNMIGQDCTVRVPYTAGVAVCVPHPVGCTCLPGYQGMWCEEECNLGEWGAGCFQRHKDLEDDFDNHDIGEVVYQAIVGVSVLVSVVSVGVLCWCWWTKKNQRVVHRPTENRNEPGPSAQQSPHYPEDSDGVYQEPIVPTEPVPVTIRNPLWVIKQQQNDNTNLPGVLEPQANEEEHIYEEVDDFFVNVQPGEATAHFHNIP